MSRKRASLQAEIRHPHAARGPPNFLPSGPLSSIRFRPQDGLRPLCSVQSNGMPFGWSNQPRLRHWRKGDQALTASEKDLNMARKQKIEGKAVARILDAQTRDIVGYLYEWNTGALTPKWKDDIVRENVVYDFHVNFTPP